MTHLLANFMKRFFSHYLPVQKGLSANTIAAYRDAIKLLLCYAADTLRKPVDKLAVEDITEKVVLGFLDYVQQVRRCSPRTRNARLAAIHSLFAFIAREEPAVMLQCQRIRAIPLKRTEHITIDYLEEKQMQAILLGKGRKHRACPLWSETVATLRAYLKQRTPKQPGTEHLAR